MTPDFLIFTYVFALVAGIFVLVVFSELRRRRFRSTQQQDRIFHCEKCDFIYTDDPDQSRSRCPQCGTLNEAIKF